MKRSTILLSFVFKESISFRPGVVRTRRALRKKVGEEEGAGDGGEVRQFSRDNAG